MPRFSGVRAVAHKATSLYDLTNPSAHGQRIAGSQSSELIALKVKQWVAGHEDPTDPLFAKRCKSRVDFARRADILHYQLHPKASRSTLHLANVGRNPNPGRIEEVAN